MARARVYRHDVRCVECGSNWVKKFGKTRGGGSTPLNRETGWR